MANGLELGDVYAATIERIKAQDGDKSRLGMTALMWISHAERPLRADELCHALAVQPGSTDFDIGNIPSISTLVSCCQGLISVDKEGSTVRLIHFTLQEYLSFHPDLLGSPHSAMAEACLAYLSSRKVQELWTSPHPDTQNTPFLEYCSIYWGVHAKRELSDSGKSLALELLRENNGPISTKSLLAQVNNFYIWEFDTVSPFSGLHCASFFGIVEVVAGLIEIECYDINEGDFSGCTPLAWAARNGHVELVKSLLERKEVNLDKPDNDNRTPLLYAAWNGHEGVVKILLERKEVNPNKPDNEGGTPLSFAAEEGHDVVTKILLGREDVDPDTPDNDGQTPVSIAAWNGHEGVVKILLERKEVNPNKPNNDGRTPLSIAARDGREGVTKILLGREDVDPDKPNKYGQTPLLYAAWNGREGVVKILLERKEVNPNKPDKYDRTPLSSAAGNGHEGVTKILLGREDVDPNKPDNDGRTPLSYAAQHGQKGVVALLDPLNPATHCKI